MNSKKVSLRTALIAASLLLAGFQSPAGSIAPVNLQCEYRLNPLGIDVARPRLIWQVQSDERDQGQAGYQILVATSKKLLQNDQGDLWDTGRISSHESINIAYAGKPLASGMRCFWKVRVWDKKGRASHWSAPAVWSMGLLAPEDWQGKWIGLDGGESPNPLGGAQWIWYPEGNPAASAPVGTRYFRRVFELPANQAVRTATLAMTADNEFRVFVNGQEAGKSDNWMTPEEFAVDALLKPGKNVLAVQARNVGNEPSPAGLIGELKVVFEQGQALTLDTDGKWKSATNLEDRWNDLAFDDTAWTMAKPLGNHGMQPWGTIGSENRRLPARYLRREFTVEKKVRRATAYICGLGLFELYLNGQKMSDDVLSPALSEYDKRAFYLTFDVTEQLKRGRNAIGVILGNGRFFAPRSSVPIGTKTFGYPKLLLQLNIEYTDGALAHIVSDGHWKLTADGPIRANNEYDGEEYDAQMERPGWCQPNFDDANWRQAQLVQPGSPVLSAQISEPIRVMQTLHPVAMTNPKPGLYIFDMGQNMAGWCRLKVAGPRGAVVKLRHGEALRPDGTLYTDNLRSAKAEDIYRLKGHGVETYEPRFTEHGFRYVEVTGFPGQPTLGAIDGRLVYDAVPAAGQFACSNPLLNQIYHNIYWTTCDNYRSMPTDLPRDERQGWFGDRQEVSKGETFLFDVAPLYVQWLTDIQDDQHSNGSLPDVSPAYWSLCQDGVVWASTYIIIPHMLYDQYDDLGILQKHYASMKKWTDYMSAFLEDDIMPRNTYADWCFPPRSSTEMKVINSNDPKLTTSGILLSTAIFYHDLCLMTRSARLLGKTEDAEHFDTLAGQIKAAFNRRFYKSKAGYYDNGTQTSCVLPLAFGLVPDEYKTNVFAHLVEKITVESGHHLGTGLIGGHYLMRVLSDNGRPDLACAIATQQTYPSWGYMISKGATTMWELWNGDTADSGMNSRNIVMLIGDLNIWLHEYLGGIRPDPEAPGFRKIIIKPEVVGGITWVKVSYDSVRGRIISEWRHFAGQFDLRITIPANTTATVYLPAHDIKSITEGGRALTKIADVKSAGMEAERAVLQVGSGHYHFVSNW
jgi:alpha-L-rhamnosidase